MPEIKIMILQGEIKFTPKFTPDQVQHVRRQYAQPMHYLDFSTLNSLACKRYPIEIKNEKDIDDEFEYIVGILQVPNQRLDSVVICLANVGVVIQMLLKSVNGL